MIRETRRPRHVGQELPKGSAPTSGLRRRSLSIAESIVWFGVSYLAAILGYLAVNAAAARMLGPDDFGHFVIIYTSSIAVVQLGLLGVHRAGLREAARILRCVQIVRDPRGVAYSWSKRVTRPEVTDGFSEMPRESAGVTALWWSAFDVLFRMIGRHGVPVATVKYEDLVADPRRCVEAALRFCDRAPAPADLHHLGPHEITLRRRHLVAGNPMRFITGQIDLIADDEWRGSLSSRDRRLVSALTVATRRRYGYLDT
jgi:Sulfotransferase domain